MTDAAITGVRLVRSDDLTGGPRRDRVAARLPLFGERGNVTQRQIASAAPRARNQPILLCQVHRQVCLSGDLLKIARGIVFGQQGADLGDEPLALAWLAPFVAAAVVSTGLVIEPAAGLFQMTYMIPTRRITSGELSKHLNGLVLLAISEAGASAGGQVNGFGLTAPIDLFRLNLTANELR